MSDEDMAEAGPLGELALEEWAAHLPFRVARDSVARLWAWLQARDCRLTLAEAAMLLRMSEAGVRQAAQKRGWTTSDPSMTWGNAHAVLLTAARVQALAEQRSSRLPVSAAPERGVSKSLAARVLSVSRTRAIQLLAAGRLTLVPDEHPEDVASTGAGVDPFSLLVEATRRVLASPTGSETAAQGEKVSASRG